MDTSEDIYPTVLLEPGKKGISFFGAISVDRGKFITIIVEGYNAITLV